MLLLCRRLVATNIMTAHRTMDVALIPCIHACPMKYMMAIQKLSDGVPWLNSVLTDGTGGVECGGRRIDDGTELELLRCGCNNNGVEKVGGSPIGDIAKGGSKGDGRSSSSGGKNGLEDGIAKKTLGEEIKNR